MEQDALTIEDFTLTSGGKQYRQPIIRPDLDPLRATVKELFEVHPALAKNLAKTPDELVEAIWRATIGASLAAFLPREAGQGKRNEVMIESNIARCDHDIILKSPVKLKVEVEAPNVIGAIRELGGLTGAGHE